MRHTMIGFAAVLGLGLGLGSAGPSQAASQMSEAEYRAALETCKQAATPQLKDECVSNAKNRFERGQGAEKKAGDVTDKAGKAAKDKAEKAAKDKAMGQSDAGMKGAGAKEAKEKGGQMMKGKAKTN